jgi:hypothetical protein
VLGKSCVQLCLLKWSTAEFEAVSFFLLFINIESELTFSRYSEPIPYYLCTKAQSDCINKCNAIASCTDECRKQNTCGAQHPKPSNGTVANTTQTSTSSTSSSTPTASSANFNGKPSSAGPMLSAHVGTIYGAAAVVAVAVGALGGFGF